MKFFQLDNSPTVQWMKQVVAGQPTEQQTADPESQPPLQASIPTETELETSSQSETAIADAVADSHHSTQASASESGPSYTPQTQAMIMPKLEKSEPISPLQPTVNTFLNRDPAKTGSDRDSHESAEIVLGKADLQWLSSTSQRIHQAATIEALLEALVMNVRQHLKVDRVLIYRFQTETQGVVVAESLTDGYTPALNKALPAISFGAKSPEEAQQQILSLNNIALVSLTPHQRQLMTQFQTKSSLSLPILLDQAWGVLVVQQCAEPKHWSDTDVALLHKALTELRLGLQLIQGRLQQQQQVKRQQGLAKLIDKIHQSQDVASVFRTTTQELRQQLQCDRVAVYRFTSEWQGEFIAESVNQRWTPLMGSDLQTVWPDEDLEKNQGGCYREGNPLVIKDISQARHSTSHLERLEQIEAKAYAIVPILEGKQLWGLLATYQNSGPRQWVSEDVTLLVQISQQLGIALHQLDYLEKLQIQSDQIVHSADQERLMDKIVARIQQSTDLQSAFTNTCREIRQFLKTDRAAIYQFNVESGYSEGETIAEDVEPGYSSVLSVSIQDHCFGERFVEEYEQGRTWCISDLQQPDLEDCFVEILSRFQAKASLVVPLIKGNKLWGLFYNHQCSAPRNWKDDDIKFVKRIAAQLNPLIQREEYIEQLQQQSAQLIKTAEQEKLIAKTVDRSQQSLNLEQAFTTTAREVRSFLKADRVAVYKFDVESGYSQGETVAEDVEPGYASVLSVSITDHCFSENFVEQYENGRVWSISDLQQPGLQTCFIEILSRFQAKASLVVPLLKGQKLWGLFYVHQCRSPRKWQDSEIELIKRIAAQFNIAIQQNEYVQQLQQQSEKLAEAAEREKAAKEQLQQQVIQVLSAVRPALNGDLTVRAPVTEDEVGTVADAYNNTLSSLRQMVIQMQETSNQVTETSQANGTAIATLANQAQEQFRALTTGLEELQIMAQTTQAVEANAQQVETAVQQANQIVLTGDAAIDRTVDEMQRIRGTVAETNKRLKRLGESSQKISKVVNLISNFTTQTQLLALNASIEATRAGEYGRGFAVVADEVRSLARQSAEAATDIEQLVQEIQASTSAVATAMEDGIQQVASGTTVVGEARQSLNAIVDATHQISELVSGITQATQTQTEQCQSVTQTMQDVAGIANQTSEDSLNISTAFQTLLTTAQDLQTTSQRFRVN
ncbi:MAG: GAF domain-containing protein [Leptolyngbya sp. SIO1D8]|nr:GAF domain-containing protein [Leptolyngbya sp. SIO1D8]